MTVSSTSSRVVYAGNGSTTVFPFAFKVAQAADLTVVFTDASGSDFTLSPSQYAATGFGLDAGGSVTYPAPGSGGPAIGSGTKLTIYRNVVVTQPTSISNQGAMWPQVIEGALDRLTYIAQKVTDAVSRALVISPTDSAVSLGELPNATTRANSVLAFDGTGQPYAATLQTAGLIGWATWIVQNFAPAANAAAGRSVLGAAGLTGNETIAGNKNFSGASSFTAGSIAVPTKAPGTNTTDAASTAFVKTKAEGVVGGTVLRSYLAGLGLSNNSGTPNSKIDVAAGVCADSTNALMLTVAAGTIDCGTTGANGIDTGTLANGTWYHAFAIGKTDGTTALLASTSVTSPTMPSGYTLKRRIGSFRTDGSAHILGFAQKDDEFLWTTPVLDLNGATPPTVAANLTVKVPTGVQVNVLLAGIALGQPAGNAVLFSSLDVSDVAPSGTGTSTFFCNNAVWLPWTVNIRTDTSGQIRQRSSSTTSLMVYGTTYGWIDRRGRDN